MWKTFYNRFQGRLSGAAAVYQASEQNRIERYFTFPNFEKSAERCGLELKKAGLSDVKVESFPADGEASWSGWKAMKAWDVKGASLKVTSPANKVIADWLSKPEGLVMYSGSCDLEGELVEWNGEAGADLMGKIPLTSLRPLDIVHSMRSFNVPGIISDFIGTLPGVRDRFDLPDDVRWENYAFKSYAGKHWGFMITPRQGKYLRDLLSKGTVRVRARIDSRTYDGTMKSATGVIKGRDPGSEEVMLVTHLNEPGANDNASGTGLSLEIARALSTAVENGTIPRPRRSIRFLYHWEGFGLLAWVDKHKDHSRSILGGINIDELGVDPAEGRSILHLFMPPAANSSCVGFFLEHLCNDLLTPEIRWKAVADRAEIINDAITADPNIDIVLPTLIQYPSRHYHASSDRIETLGAQTMEKLGNLCATYLYFLADADEKESLYLSRIVEAAAQKRLRKIGYRLMEGSWLFGYERTRKWLADLFACPISSLKKFGLPDREARALGEELASSVDTWCRRYRDLFKKEPPRKASDKDIRRASTLILSRTTPGAPMPPEILLSPEEASGFFDTLYSHNLDLVFLRVFYWADGKRSLMDIISRLEFEMDELYRDTSIARTATGSLIDSRVPVEIDPGAMMHIIDVVVRHGYLKSVTS